MLREGKKERSEIIVPEQDLSVFTGRGLFSRFQKVRAVRKYESADVC